MATKNPAPDARTSLATPYSLRVPGFGLDCWLACFISILNPAHTGSWIELQPQAFQLVACRSLDITATLFLSREPWPFLLSFVDTLSISLPIKTNCSHQLRRTSPVLLEEDAPQVTPVTRPC